MWVSPTGDRFQLCIRTRTSGPSRVVFHPTAPVGKRAKDKTKSQAINLKRKHSTSHPISDCVPHGSRVPASRSTIAAIQPFRSNANTTYQRPTKCGAYRYNPPPDIRTHEPYRSTESEWDRTNREVAVFEISGTWETCPRFRPQLPADPVNPVPHFSGPEAEGGSLLRRRCPLCPTVDLTGKQNLVR
jgi:hypothetical protein